MALETGYGSPQPLYCVKQFNDSTYSVTKFKRSELPYINYREPDASKKNDKKLDQAFSRARSKVREYGLCNPWDYFVTITLDKTKYNRYDLRKFREDLIQFILDERKKYRKISDKKVSYVFVPETHKDGAWHMHGLVYGLPESAVCPFEKGKHPDYLVNNGFLNWPAYAAKFGFVSLGIIRDQLSTVLYTTKYISKDVEALREMQGEHLYIPCRGMKTAKVVADVYNSEPELDKKLTQHYKFCSTGFVTGESWHWPLQFGEDYEAFPGKPPELKALKPDPAFRPETIDPSWQMNIFDLCEGAYVK